MYSRPGPLEGLWIFERPTHEDQRGFFREVFQARELEAELGRPVTFLQINHSRSRRGVLRGLHAEGWDKLVYVPRGEVFTALADIRPLSPTFAQVAVFRFDESNRACLFVPRGLAHGYYVMSDEADYVYQVTAYYDGSDTRAVAWDDPDLAVPWPSCNPILSERDQCNPTLAELFPECIRAQGSRVYANGLCEVGTGRDVQTESWVLKSSEN
jgi:dTDP-4-dehydrorhamnose 3,5-epimerase